MTGGHANIHQLGELVLVDVVLEPVGNVPGGKLLQPLNAQVPGGADDVVHVDGLRLGLAALVRPVYEDVVVAAAQGADGDGRLGLELVEHEHVGRIEQLEAQLQRAVGLLCVEKGQDDLQHFRHAVDRDHAQVFRLLRLEKLAREHGLEVGAADEKSLVDRVDFDGRQ